MPDLNELQTFLKADNCENGDVIKFIDGGKIFEKDFKQKDGSMQKKITFEATVMLNGEKKKIYSPNTTTLKLLKAAWGNDSDDWVGRKGEVNIVKQIVFDQLKNVLVVVPITGTIKPADIQKDANELKPQPEPLVASTNSNPGGITDAKDVPWEA